MADDILLNNNIFHFSEDGLPCLVTYIEKSGGSHLTITLIADLFLSGSKILFLTAYPMAKDNFFQQTEGEENKIVYVKKVNDLIGSEKSQAIILKSGDEKLYLSAIETLPDIDERVILIKNIEAFSDEIIKKSLPIEKIILSGDVDKCPTKKQINNKLYKTIIAFSEPEIKIPITVPKLDKYQGYLFCDDKEGLVDTKTKS